MPAYPVSQEWTPPISVEAGDVLQNRGFNRILISRADPASEADALSLAPAETFIVQAPMSLRAAAAGPGISRLVLAVGLALRA